MRFRPPAGYLAAALLPLAAYTISGTASGAYRLGTPARAVAAEPSVAHGTRGVGEAAPRPFESATLAVDAALEALLPTVTRMSDAEALRTAFGAYFKYREAYPDRVRNPYLYFVDLGLDNRTPRGYVFDMEALEVVDGPFMVSHGRGSDRAGEGIPSAFSNQPGSKASSLGLYLAEETYGFSGKSGGRAYRSVGLRLRGESGEFNSAARARGIVAHGATYVNGTRAGRSEGCPAMEAHRAERLLPMLSNGGVVFLYSPNDARWLAEDPWVGMATDD